MARPYTRISLIYALRPRNVYGGLEAVFHRRARLLLTSRVTVTGVPHSRLPYGIVCLVYLVRTGG